MVVDDDDIINIRQVKAYLFPYNIDVLFARSGTDAIEKCRMNPDLSIVFMDILMREMNGFETAEKIMQINKSITIIYQAAYVNDFLKDEIMTSLVCSYIGKPIKKELLLAEIRKHINVTKKSIHEEC